LSSVTAEPIALTWSGSTYGPDGPWPAVEIDIGFSTQQPIAMYPGAEFASYLLTSDYCNQNKSLPCYGSQAGLYNSAQSQLEQSGSDAFIQYAPGSNFMNGVNIIGGKAKSWVDYWNIGDVTVANVSMALVSNAFAQYPGGDAYPLTVGCMGYGAPGTINQTFSNDFGPAVNASLIPGYLSAKGSIKSNSFGMHIGSVNPPIKGSFYFGGYDQNRIVGDVLTGEGSTHSTLSLKDISIDVLDGQSPWNFTSLGGLLAAGNNSISSGGIDVKVDGCSPYLTFPKSTCDALASHLPVKFNKKLGLYTWNTDDVKYSQIVSSASALRFTFLAGSNTKNVTISVPFRHLNLTLQQPLVSSDTPYFPCFTGSDSYTLGRAFLQDAFIGANWGKETWWLAQAPGPNVPSASVIELGKDENTIKPSQNDWKESWSGSWKALTTDDVNSGQSVSPVNEGNNTTPANTGSTGLSTGATAGMGVGIAIGALAIIGLAVFFWRRHK
ncbi:aspartic peptidase domain-containing protein, partial [Microdochium trichocladiopsis]